MFAVSIEVHQLLKSDLMVGVPISPTIKSEKPYIFSAEVSRSAIGNRRSSVAKGAICFVAVRKRQD